MPEQKTDAQIREEKTAAAKEATKPTSPDATKMIAALRRERAALEQQGKTDRVAQVDEQLAHYGYTPDDAKSDDKADDGKSGDDVKAAARKQPPQGRTAKPQQQTGD